MVMAAQHPAIKAQERTVVCCVPQDLMMGAQQTQQAETGTSDKWLPLLPGVALT